ncbi:Predicted DNA-binding protein, MmcQ/YjbR family [Cohaesibacter sp. ES.047]|uniref:MmcQ/YjbR family DNA-binding protein n=1 Tax=Cohaesibacter sp. ES.047 TaxID=1798205 RepID=UPI000BB7A7E3|nr:MmcQ/YjbR family DNA-binding protein [Cohaesibacter sp. ES.047]SNY90354.1 Predicted DNA-binding protein, MmcQ/YjbR family [Cohaesibacter sp. ES.047]
MTRAEFDAYCGAMTGTTNVIQWGNASVWKIGGKIFAICSNWGSKAETGHDDDGPRFSFKCSDLAFELLPDQEGIVPAPYLARAKWVQLQTPDAMSDEDLKLHLDKAYEIIARKLTAKHRKELRLDF